MRRPLCAVCLAFAAAVGVIQGIWKPPQSFPLQAEGQAVTVTGQVYQREISQSSYYGEQQVLYLKDISSIQFQDRKWNQEFSNQQAEGVICRLEGSTLQNSAGEEIKTEDCAADGSGEKSRGRLGSTVIVTGRFRPFYEADVPGGFDQAEYYRTQGYSFAIERAEILQESAVYDRLGEWLEKIRLYTGEILEKVLGSKDASVLKAMLLGDKKSLDQETKKRYQEASISHILCISGLHISFLGMGLYRLGRRLPLPERAVTVFCILVMGLYGKMTGMSASALRAILMFSLGLLARSLGRSYDFLTALSIAAVCILAEQPLYIRHSGFLLSFGAVLGIGLITPVLWGEETRAGKKEGFFRKRGSALKKAAAGGLGVFLATLPVLVQTFYEVAPYSLLLNLVVIPLSTVLLPAGLLIPVCYQLWPPLAGLPGLLCHGILGIYEKGSIWSSRLPGSRWTVGHVESWQVLFYYGMLAVFLFLANRYAKEFGGLRKLLLLVGAVAVLTMQPGVSGMRVVMLDVGQGDCFFVQRGRTEILIDGGSSSKKNTGTWQILPALKYYGIREVDYVLLSHTDEDHVNGIQELLEAGDLRCDVLCLPEGAVAGKEKTQTGEQEERSETKHSLSEPEEKIISAAFSQAGKKPAVCRLTAGDELEAGGLFGVILHPFAGEMHPDANSTSMVLWLEGEGCTFVFMGDLPGEKEALVLDAVQTLKAKRNADGEDRAGPLVLKAGHHGSDYSTTEELLEELHPALTLISCGQRNSYGHPGKEMLERVKKSGSQVLVTARDGTCILKVRDGIIRLER